MPKLLVVDDDLDMLSLVRAALEKDGHQVDTEADAATVLPARCQLYDLLLLDGLGLWFATRVAKTHAGQLELRNCDSGGVVTIKFG